MDTFKEIRNKHLALVQFYRWFQVYEVPFNQARIDNQLDILSDTVEIITPAGTFTGRDDLEDRLRVYVGWENAHHVLNVHCEPGEKNTLKLYADILYQNIRPDGDKHSATIHYDIVLELRENDLPLFTSVKLTLTGNIENPDFQPTYAENRAKSFMYYWLYLMETADSNAHKFKELLSENFRLSLSTGVIVDTTAEFDKWIESVALRVKSSAYSPKNFLEADNTNQTINVYFDIDWRGITVEGIPLSTETHHEWILENNPDERFARIRQMNVTEV